MKKWITPTILGLILLGLGFWLGRRSNKPLAFEVYDPQTGLWQDLQTKAAKGRLSLFCSDGEEFLPCVDFDRADSDSRVMLVPINEVGLGNSIAPAEPE
jgi:LPXTG-motif cell wall-anchored protein